MSLENKQIGETVYMGCASHIGADKDGDIEIIDIEVRFDGTIGENYNVLVTNEGNWDSRTGNSVDNKNCTYFVT